MKISVSSYSFNRMMLDGKTNQLDCIALAQELGFEGIEFTNMAPHDGSSPAEYAGKIRRECEQRGLAICNYAVGSNLMTPADGSLSAEIARVKAQVDIAAELGTPFLRHDISFVMPSKSAAANKGYTGHLPMLADACQEISEYAREKGIGTLVENHGFFFQDSLRVEALINTVDCDNFGLLCDMGNFLCVDEDPLAACSLLATYARHVHAKDFHVKSGSGPSPGEGFFLKSRQMNYLRGAIVGHGVVPVLQCLATLKNAGYDGFVSIEFEGIENNMTALRIGRQNLLNYLEQIG